MTKSESNAGARMVAIVLALGGSIWGLFLLLVGGPRVFILPPFAVGYLVTARYLLRALTVPSLKVRRFIWGASILVQGSWLCVGIADIPVLGPNVLLVWWLFATVASVFAVTMEEESVSDYLP